MPNNKVENMQMNLMPDGKKEKKEEGGGQAAASFKLVSPV